MSTIAIYDDAPAGERRWQTILAIDFDAHAAATYRANFPACDVRCSTVAEQMAQLPYAHVIVGGPPCQDFSTAGKGAGKEGDRNGWPDAIEAVRRMKPRMFLFENVPGMLNQRHRRYAQEVFAELGDCGYTVDARELDAVNYGVPQFRNRLWLWGIRTDLYVAGARHCWPAPTHQWPWAEAGIFGDAHGLLPAVTCGWALNIPHMQRDGVWFEGDGESTIIGIRRAGGKNSQQEKYGHTYTPDEPCPTVNNMGNGGSGTGLDVHEYRHSAAMLAKHPPASPASPASTVQAKWFKGGAEGLVEVECDPKHPVQQCDRPATTLNSGGNGNGPTGNAYTIDTKQKRTEHGMDEPAAAAAADDRKHIKKDGVYVRRLTPLECARLQSCPDDMKWPDKIAKTAMYKIIGNGWACGIAAALSRALKQADPTSRTVIDLFCGGGLGALGWHRRYWSWNHPRTRSRGKAVLQ